jgi:hypothetical protein
MRFLEKFNLISYNLRTIQTRIKFMIADIEALMCLEFKLFSV